MLHSPQILLAPRSGIVAAAVSTATWDPASAFQLTLSGGNLTGTNSVGSGSFGNARSTTSHSTGKFYVEWTITFSVTSQCGIGLVDTTQASPSGYFLGGAVHAMGVDSAGHAISYNGSSLGSIAASAPSSGDVVGIAVDIGGGKIWGRINAGAWNNDILANQNPATGTGGYSTSLSGALFLCCDVESNTISGTLNAGGSAYANAAPAGFGVWT